MAEKLWNGRLKLLIKGEVIKLRDKSLDQMLGIRFQDMMCNLAFKANLSHLN